MASRLPASNLAKVDILLNVEPVERAFGKLLRDSAQRRGRQREKLRSLIPRQMIEIPVQAQSSIK
jgi:translation elongation factor EF-4